MNLLLLTVFCFIIPKMKCAVEKSEPLDILMFGGNGFIGGHTSEALLADGHKLTLINRGSWSWDLAETVKPFVAAALNVDRLAVDAAEKFQTNILDKRSRPFDVVLDFSAYKLDAFRPFYEKLKSQCKLYVYISTDSVYEVSDHSLIGQDGLLEEVHSIRPSDEETALKLSRLDKYGHQKFEIEEYMEAQRNNDSAACQHLMLRLPDVLGERDSTRRWWKYQLWLEYAATYLNSPVVIPNSLRNLKTGYVYVKDVARFLSHVVAAVGADKHKLWKDVVYNFAYDEPKSLRELLLHVKQSARLNFVDFPKTNTPDGVFLLPSVTRGGLNMKRFHAAFPEFEFTPWDSMVHQVVKFYEKAFFDYPREREQAAVDLCADLELTEKACKKFTTFLLVESERKRKTEF